MPLGRTYLVAALAIATCALAAPDALARPVLFVGNVDDGTVTLADARSFAVLGTLNVIPDGDTPRDPAQAAVYPGLVQAKGVNYVQGLAVSPGGKVLYVSRGFLGDVAAFAIGSGKLLWRLQISGFRADHIALSPDGLRLFVSALTSNEVQVIDTQKPAFAGSFPAGDWPHVLEFSPDGRFVYNGSLGNQLLPEDQEGARQITVADAKTLAVVRTLPFDAGVRPFAFSRHGSRLYVQLSFLNGFKEVDPVSGAVLRSVDLPVMGPGRDMARDDYPNEAAHHGIALSGDGRTICDAATISNYVALVDRRSLATKAIVPVPDEPAEAETSLDGRYCFVSNRGANGKSVSVIEYAHAREVKRIPAGNRPQEEAEAVVPERVLRAAGYVR